MEWNVADYFGPVTVRGQLVVNVTLQRIIVAVS